MLKHDNTSFSGLEIGTLSLLSGRSTAGSETGVFAYPAVDLFLRKRLH